MNSKEQTITDFLCDLKLNNHVSGLKTEFGEEGTTVEEAFSLKKIAKQAELDFTIKIGGSEAVKDLYDTKSLDAHYIVAPMIESPYAAKKYIDCVKTVFTQEELKEIKLYINIETKYGFKYLHEILESEFADYISGIVFGRTDFACSLGMSKEDVNSKIIYDYSQEASLITKRFGKEFVIGGGVSPSSLDFFKKLPYVSKIETRNIIYDAQELLSCNNAKESVLKGVEFEIMRLKNKQKVLGVVTQKDLNRIKILESRLEKVNR